MFCFVYKSKKEQRVKKRREYFFCIQILLFRMLCLGAYSLDYSVSQEKTEVRILVFWMIKYL